MRTQESMLVQNMLSRRGFLKMTGAGAMLASLVGLAGCSAPDAQDTAAGSAAGSAGGETISVTVANSNPPYCSVDASGNPTGYDVAVLQAVDDYLDDYTFNISAMEFSSMITACQSGSSPLVSCQLVPNDERKQTFIFTEEPFTLSPLVFVTTDPNCKTLADMAGKTVASNPINYEYTMLEAYNEKYPDQAVVLQTYQNITPADAFRMVASGQVDSYMIYDGTADQINEEAGTGLYKTDIVMVESTYLMLNKDYADLRDACDKALKALKADGTMSDIATQYLGCDVFTEYADVLSDNELIAG